MPFARLTVADPDLDVALQENLVAGITRLLEDDLHKEAEVAVVHVNLVPAERWFVGGQRHLHTTGAHLEVSITAGTNTATEKARFIADAYELLRISLGMLPDAVYVALYQLDGEGYGYNGISQIDRHHSN